MASFRPWRANAVSRHSVACGTGSAISIKSESAGGPSASGRRRRARRSPRCRAGGTGASRRRRLSGLAVGEHIAQLRSEIRGPSRPHGRKSHPHPIYLSRISFTTNGTAAPSPQLEPPAQPHHPSEDWPGSCRGRQRIVALTSTYITVRAAGGLRCRRRRSPDSVLVSMSARGRHTGFNGRASEFERFAELAGAMGVKGLRVTDVQVVGTADSPRVHMCFQHENFSGALFAYESMPAGVDRHELVWLAEELATGALHRLMRDEQPLADKDGLIWVRLRGQVLAAGRSTTEPPEP
jgi:hypothetical protein